MWRSAVGCLFSSMTRADLARSPDRSGCSRPRPAWPSAARSDRGGPDRRESGRGAAAIRSAAVNWSGMSMSQDSARILDRSGPALAPRPGQLIASMPQAMPTSMAPVAISPAIRWLACWALPHLAVDGGGTDLLGQSGRQPGRPGDVVGLLAVLGDAAADGLLDERGVDLKPGPPRTSGRPREVRWHAGRTASRRACRWGCGWLRR